MPEWIKTSTEILTLAVMLIGLFGLVLPIFPGGVVIWLAALAYGLLIGFSPPGVIFFVLISILAIGSVLADNVLMAGRAHKEGASWWSIIIALFSGLVVTVLLPPFGGLVAAPIALYLAEYIRHRDWDQAMNATKGMLIGCGWAFFVRFGLGVLKIGLWAAWAWGNFA